jgi:hypothetical protein
VLTGGLQVLHLEGGVDPFDSGAIGGAQGLIAKPPPQIPADRLEGPLLSRHLFPPKGLKGSPCKRKPNIRIFTGVSRPSSNGRPYQSAVAIREFR